MNFYDTFENIFYLGYSISKENLQHPLLNITLTTPYFSTELNEFVRSLFVGNYVYLTNGVIPKRNFGFHIFFRCHIVVHT